jgi:hypothetical protein
MRHYSRMSRGEVVVGNSIEVGHAAESVLAMLVRTGA